MLLRAAEDAAGELASLLVLAMLVRLWEAEFPAGEDWSLDSGSGRTHLPSGWTHWVKLWDGWGKECDG